jgi:ATP-binding cassette, subfamily B, multidrug efflux pump
MVIVPSQPMRHLSAINKYFIKYKWRFLLGILFIVLSNYFKILAPQVTGYVVNAVEVVLKQSTGNNNVNSKAIKNEAANYDLLVQKIIKTIEAVHSGSFSNKILLCGIVLLAAALLSSFFLFLMRQTIIVMSRFIEYDQKNEIFDHYQQLDAAFYKRHSTGDLMNRITEDVSRVRMYTGPALMYFINLAATIGFCLYFMIRQNWQLTLYVLAPLPLLAITIYYVNTIIHRKSERIQALLSDLTTASQESYSGIRVIKSFVQEGAMKLFFAGKSEDYRSSAIGLAKMEAIYFPSMSLLIGLSTLLTIMIGGVYAINGTGNVSTGTIAEFVMYINMLTFPVSAIGWTASMIQRAAASQKRLNEFLDTKPSIQNKPMPVKKKLEGTVSFEKVNFIYPDTGIHALKDITLHIKKGQKIAIIGRTGSGKTTIAQLLLRMYDVANGAIKIDDVNVKEYELQSLRNQVSYVPQDVFLFSDTVTNNIRFGKSAAPLQQVKAAAISASVDKEILQFAQQYDTMIGERGVTLSGGQKQRISIARALLKDPELIIFDDCLSAVDTKTEKEIITNLYNFLQNKTAIIITHRIFTLFDFDNIIVLDDGSISETGTHQQLMALNGYYAQLYRKQQTENTGAGNNSVTPANII